MSLLYRLRDTVPMNIMKTLYDAPVLPDFNYYTPIWDSVV